MTRRRNLNIIDTFLAQLSEELLRNFSFVEDLFVLRKDVLTEKLLSSIWNFFFILLHSKYIHFRNILQKIFSILLINNTWLECQFHETSLLFVYRVSIFGTSSIKYFKFYWHVFLSWCKSKILKLLLQWRNDHLNQIYSKENWKSIYATWKIVFLSLILDKRIINF